jgi:adenylate cyclase
VVVTINEKDINTVGQLPISDSVLATVINKIAARQPKAIALDLYRDLPVPPGNRDLQQVFNSIPNLYVVEKVIGDAIPPPANISREQVGFADLVLDSDGKVRRALLSLVGEDKQTRFSLGTKLALHYLQGEKTQLVLMNHNRYRLGKAIFERFTANSGGYVGADGGGYQVLLNYWGTAANFRQYSLTEVLNEEIAAHHIRDRLILIGSTAESVKDAFYTPYSKGWFRSPAKMPGVFIQANVTSQIISAAIDNRPLLRTHNKFLEFLWILLWGIVGVTIAWRWQQTVAIAFYLCLSAIILIITCYLAFLSGWWLPLIPALLTLTGGVVTAVFIRNKQQERLIFQLTLELLLAEAQNHPLTSRIALEYFKRSENTVNSNLIERQIKKLIDR